jgi:hypothetical protein
MPPLNVKKALAFLLVLGICLSLPAVFGADSPAAQDCLRLTGEINIGEFFSALLEKKQPGTLNLGNDVTALVTPWPRDDKQGRKLGVRPSPCRHRP